MKKAFLWIAVAAIVIAIALSILPLVEIDTGKKLIRCSYTGDFSQYDVNHSYNEAYCYNEKHDVSIGSFDVKKHLFFYTIHMEYVEGDVRQREFVLDEDYITYFIENARIYDNPDNIDLAALIEAKEAVVGNTRYTTDNGKSDLYYELDGKQEEMYVFYTEDLLVIQVGSVDEQPRFIAYREK